MLFTAEDAQWLRKSGEILHDQIEQILDVWYGSSPRNLIFSKPSPTPQPASPTRLILPRSVSGLPAGSATLDPPITIKHLARLSIRDRAAPPPRGPEPHGRGACRGCRAYALHARPALSSYRHSRTVPGAKGGAAAEVQRMREAWTKSVLLQLILWCEPYVDPEDF